MPIPLGIFAVAGAGSTAAAAYELISTAYGNGSSSTITFSSIPQDYKHLELRWTARGTGNWDSIGLQFNGSGMTKTHTLQVENSISSSVGATGQMMSAMAPSSATANIHSAGVMSIIDYTSPNKNKTAKSFQNYYYPAYAFILVMNSHFQVSTSAISSISLYGWNGTNFTTTSRFSLYGIRG